MSQDASSATNTLSLPVSPTGDEDNISVRSGSPPPGQNFEMLDLADLTDNISVASFGEAAGSNTSESSHMSSNLLKLETRGFLGLFERLPLPLKIALLVLFSAIGFVTLSAFAIGISAKMMNSSVAASEFISHGALISSLLFALQIERGAGRMMLFSSTTATQIEYLKSIPTTESAISKMLTVVDANKEQYGATFTDFLEKRPMLDSIRAKTTARTASVTDLLESYQSVIRTVLNLLHHSNAALDYDCDTSSVGVFKEFNEATFVTTTVAGLLIRVPSMRDSLLPMLDRYRGMRETTATILVNSGPVAPVQLFTKNVLQSPAGRLYDAMVEEISTKPSDYSFNATVFDATAYQVASSLLLNDYFSDDVQAYATTITNQSIGIIVAVIIIVIFFASTSISNAILFALSIIGPWQRLNALQESTISKFVPKGFLSLMGWKSISQAALGKFQEKDATILVVRIANYANLESAYKESPGQLYDFVNAFLAYVGPYIRNNSGYIDKFNSNHFIAIFQKDKKGIKAALEIQQSMANFNKMQTAFSVSIRMTLVSGKVVMGTIGENERMESTSLSGIMRLALKLQKVAKRANASILTNRDTLSKLQNPKAIHQRYIGLVKLKSEFLGSCDLCEILTFTDPAKVKTKDHFTKAVRCLQGGRFQDALSIFESIAQSNPSDTLAVRYRDLTKQSIMENVKRLSELTVTHVLQVPTLRCALEQMCIQEHSTENINLWNQIQMFKECQSAEERRSIATRICEEYLQLEGKQAVNLSAEQMAAVKRVVKSNNAILTPLLFVEVEAQVEHLMVDTIKRLKQTQQFKLEFLKSSLSFKPEEIELL